MKQLHIIISEEMAKELNRYPNKSDVVREAISMYNEATGTDTLKGIRTAFAKMSSDMVLLDEKLQKLLVKLEELSYR